MSWLRYLHTLRDIVFEPDLDRPGILLPLFIRAEGLKKSRQMHVVNSGDTPGIIFQHWEVDPAQKSTRASDQLMTWTNSTAELRRHSRQEE